MKPTDKRESIIDALERILKNRRFDEVTVEEIADAAKVGKGTVYRYFEDKEDLFFQMVQQRLQEGCDAVRVVALSAGRPRDKLVRAAETMSKHIQRHGATIRAMHTMQFARRRPGANTMMREHHERLNGHLTRMLTEARNQGLLRKDLDCRLALCLFRGLILERTMMLMHGGMEMPVDDLVDLLLGGLAREDR